MLSDLNGLTSLFQLLYLHKCERKISQILHVRDVPMTPRLNAAGRQKLPLRQPLKLCGDSSFVLS
jgi:hypothetical protein